MVLDMNNLVIPNETSERKHLRESKTIRQKKSRTAGNEISVIKYT